MPGPSAASAKARLDFDNPGFQTNPWPLYEWHRQHAPVSWSEEMKCYFLFGYESAHQALTSREYTAFHPFRRSRVAFGASALDSEGSEHTRQRAAMSGSFRPRLVSTYSARIVEPIVTDLLGGLLSTDRPDFADELAWRLPTRVACRLLGLPESDDALLFSLMRPLLLYVDHAEVRLEHVVRHREQLRDYLRAAAGQAGAATSPADLLRTMTADESLDDAEALNNAVLLLAAATETTGASIVNLLARVAAQPGLFERVRAEPSVIPAVVNETLRHEPPLHVTLRYAAEDVELGGVILPGGAPIQVCLASANRDPSIFTNPHEWSLETRRATPLTFGMGRHHCLGSGLAQLELTSILRTLALRLQSLWAIAPKPPLPAGRTFRRVPGLLLGYRHVPGAAR